MINHGMKKKLKEVFMAHQGGIELFFISFLSLYFEILFIRWIPTQLPLFAFFRTVILLACFFGLGFGCLYHGKLKNVIIENQTILLMLAIGFLIIIIISAGTHIKWKGFGHPAVADVVNGRGEVLEERSEDQGFTLEFQGKELGGKSVIITFFALIVLVFIPFGIILAEKFKLFMPLPAYTINILGSLSGIVCFTVISFLKASPFVWLLIGMLPLLMFLRKDAGKLTAGCIIAAIIITPFLFVDRDALWSPYQKITFKNISCSGGLVGGGLYVNDEYHQPMINFSQKIKAYLRKNRESELLRFVVDHHHAFAMPYRFINPKNVLIIASGVGNEASAAVIQGVEEIDAVEIDPIILEVGRRYHPQKPYQNGKVTVFNDDARSYLSKSSKKYDLIVMNQVDSHSQYAVSANLRLDSYLYTVECFKQIRAHLNPGGIFTMIFSGYHWPIPWVRRRLLEMLRVTFGENSWEARTVFGGKFLKIVPKEIVNDAKSSSVRLATDDWPQFYMKRRSIPPAYLEIMVWMALISGTFLFLGMPELRKKFEWHFFLLGAGFMLLEVQSISRLSLLFGNTWIVNSAVLSGVLCAILCANAYVSRHALPVPAIRYYPLLIGMLAVSYAAPIHAVLQAAFSVKVLCALLFVGLPVFFAGVIFAGSFMKTAHAPVSLGFNLVGGMLGGLGEYTALVLGVKNLSFVIIILYILSAVPLMKIRLLQRN